MKILYKNKNWKINEEYNLNKILYLLIDRPSKINSHYNNFIWKNKIGQWHRDYDLPAFINNVEGHVSWCKNNEWHRENNKPAVILANSIKEYYKK